MKKRIRKYLKKRNTLKRNMTICIAVIFNYQDKEGIIFATDNMISIDEIGQFEQDVDKYKIINKKTIAMLSGELSYFNELLNLKKNFVKRTVLQKLSFDDISERILSNFQFKRDGIIHNWLNRFSLTKDEYKNCLLNNDSPNEFMEKIFSEISELSLGTEILIAGIENGEVKITVINGEDKLDFEKSHFHCIGTGSNQAINTLLFQRHSKNNNLNQALYNIYKAKRNAEVMEGVGKETQINILLPNFKIKRVGKNDLEILENIYKDELEFGKKDERLKKLEIK